MESISECRKLAEQVLTLSTELGRPVSSKDLLAWYRRHPEQRPLLLQAVGQQLFKAAQRKGVLAEPIHRIGVHGNLAYYAPEPGTYWSDAFHIFVVQERARRALKLAIPNYASALIGSEYEVFARNAAQGFLDEWEPKMTLLVSSKWQLASIFGQMLGAAKLLGSGGFIAEVPLDLFDRSGARLCLLAEIRNRRPDSCAERTNLNRHLVLLKWPQAEMFARHRPAFCEAQIRHYCGMKWPNSEIDFERAGAIYRCLAYGAYALPSTPKKGLF